MPELQGIGHVTLTVTDPQKSAEFYNRVFETQTVLDIEDEHGPAVLIAGPAFMMGFRCHATTGKNDAFDPTKVGLDHLGVHVASREELEKWQARAAELGVTYTEIVETPYGLHLNVKDPDEIPIEFFVPAQG